MAIAVTPEGLRAWFAKARITPDMLRKVHDLGPTGLITADMFRRTYQASSSATLALNGNQSEVIVYDHDTVTTDLRQAGAGAHDAEPAWLLASDQATTAVRASTEDWLPFIFISPLAWRMRRTMRSHGGFELAARPTVTPDDTLVDTYIHADAPDLRITLAMPAFTDGAVECEATILDRHKAPAGGASGHLCHGCGAEEAAAGLRDMVKDIAAEEA
ncbi:hypothetical protein ACOQFV_30625 [Nocardiopsis changdeensis]|uniref:Uncharacterized protein n=1 Tax=Nocardiopsis changdeensis TaxID=2831969 RepID=A0ABX8BPJ9_9ACTN|nr:MULTISPECIES: hypothetical protein [Nocardiopsis]QUX24165.1 hypothetical protein KGD84_07640 [Nocardiopsis changdeensis]QYX34560.1 hypothetical protein K1J57_17100 [Nocardiopsis sp. MT53]